MRQFTSLFGQNLEGQLGFHDSNNVKTDVNCGRGQPDHPQITFPAFKSAEKTGNKHTWTLTQADPESALLSGLRFITTKQNFSFTDYTVITRSKRKSARSTLKHKCWNKYTTRFCKTCRNINVISNQSPTATNLAYFYLSMIKMICLCFIC